MYDLILEDVCLVTSEGISNDLVDLAITNGLVARIGHDLSREPAKQRVAIAGDYVSAGWIDFHVHCFAYSTDYGTFPDSIGVGSGTTTVVDQGSAGALTFPGFYQFMVKPAKTRVLSFLNVGLAGTIKGSMLPPLHGPEMVDVDFSLQMIAQYPQVIRGIKTHAEMGGVSRWGYEVLKLAKNIASKASIPLYVHTGRLIPALEDRLPNPDDVIPEALKYLGPGDILTHCFTGHEGGILSRSGYVHESVKEALESGLLLDVGYGEHFSFDTAQKVLDQGVKPYILSSDVHAAFGQPHSLEARYGLAGAMSRMMAFGFSLPDVTAMVTQNPAQALGLSDDVGVVSPGRSADLTVFTVEQGDYVFSDPWGAKRPGQSRIVPLYAVRQGQLYSVSTDG